MVTRREVLAGAAALALPAQRPEPEVWILPPPWPGDGRCLKEMASRDAEWQDARALVAGLGYWPWLLNQHFSDEELRAVFARLRAWQIGFGLETPVYKGSGWGYDGKPLDAAGAMTQFGLFEERFLRAGMPEPRWIAFDEPIYAARHAAPRHVEAADRLRHGADEVTRFVAMMRRSHPRVRLGDIEPYPALSVAEITGAVASVQRMCGEQRARGLDFLRLDVDWSLFAAGQGSWAEVRSIEQFCRRTKLRFSLIYWAAEEPRLSPERRADPHVWRDGILKQAAAYRSVGGAPDEVVVESWLHTPQHAVPATDSTTFTASVVALARAMGLRPHRNATSTTTGR
jgi:hypothetical protein